ncbi:MAG: arsenite methyltransferase [Thermodesulfobacteriota bacterium]
MKTEEIKKVVRDRYAQVAQQKSSCCGPAASCCGPTLQTEILSKRIGYQEEDLKAVPEGANLGLGCGNPLAHSALKEGDTVIDLGSGAGFDCFLAANQVGKNGRVIGVDMTPEMIDKARQNAQKGNYANVEFRLGEIENLPVADNKGDMIISNCVINLSPDKPRVFKEAFRVLKPGGRLMVSDVVLLKELPEEIKNSVSAYVSCLGGAVMKEDYLEAVKEAGFAEIRIMDEKTFPVDLMTNDPTVKAVAENLNVSQEKAEGLAKSVASIKVSGIKPMTY